MNNIKKIIEYGLYLLVFLLPIQTRWIIKAGELNGGYSEYGTISLYATDVVLLGVLLLFSISWVLKPKITNYELRITNYWWMIAGLELFVFISIFFAPNKLLAIYGYVKLLLGIGLFWLLVSAEYNRVKLLWSFIAGVVLQALLGIWQFSIQSSFASKWLGIAVHNPSELGTSVVETIGFDGVAERWLRAYGGLDHPNILGGFLSIALLLLVAFYINKKSEEHGNSSKIFNFQFLIFKQFSIFKFLNFQAYQGMLCVTCYVLCVVALFFTFSRGAWAGFLAGLIAMLAILLWQKNKQAMKKALEFIVAGTVIILLLFNLYSNLVLMRLSKDTRLEIKSNTERLESYKEAWEIIKDNWLFGVGIGNYTLALNEEAKLPAGSLASEYQPTHNVFLLVWAEIGIFGLAGFLGFLLCVMRYVLYEKKNNEKALNVALGFSVLVALAVMMLVDHWYWSLHFGVLFLWLVVGLVLLDFSDNECYNNQVILNKKN